MAWSPSVVRASGGANPSFRELLPDGRLQDVCEPSNLRNRRLGYRTPLVSLDDQLGYLLLVLQLALVDEGTDPERPAKDQPEPDDQDARDA